MKTPRILVITGPTASGKTALALRLAETLNGEIVNADSVQVYNGFHIGSGAPTEAEKARVPHHLFEILEAQEAWNAGLFRERAMTCIEDITGRGKVPIITGGTGLYIRALLSGLVDVAVSAEAQNLIDEKEQDLFTQKLTGNAIQRRLYQWLAEIDSESAEGIDPNDSQRTRRALLVALSTDSSLKQLQQEQGSIKHCYTALVFCLVPERTQLYSRIESRVKEMIANGFVNEVRELRKKFGEQVKPLHSIGYKSALRFVRGECSAQTFESEMTQDTRRFAKRQETWWRHQPKKLGWNKGEAELQSFEDVVHLTQDFFGPGQAGIPDLEVGFYLLSGVGFHPELG